MLFTSRDFKILLKLAIPIILAGLVESSNGFISVIFLGHLGKDDLAAGSLVAWFFATLMVILWGMFVGISTLISRHDGAKDHTGVALIIRDSLWLTVILTIPVGVMIWNLSPILQFFGEKKSLVEQAVPYMHALSWSIFADFAGLALIQLMIGLGRVRANLIFSCLWVPMNIFFNYVFIFGKFGSPAFGIAGLGWGTTVTYWVSTIGLMIYMLWHPSYKKYLWALKTFTKPKFMWEIIKVGLPMGTMWFFEVGCFFTVALFMGYISVDALAANQIVVQFVGLFTSVVFSIAQAITVRMGNQIGAKKPASAQRGFYAGIMLSFIFVMIVACVEWFFPNFLISFDLSKMHGHTAQVVHYAVLFFSVAAVFQILEGIRISIFGALRAHKDTHFALISTVIGFWIVGISLGYALHFWLGPVSYWAGLAVGVLPNIALLAWRYKSIVR